MTHQRKTAPTRDAARNQCERVINDGVGAFDSACTLAIAHTCQQRQVAPIVNIAAVAAWNG
jgi:hypothetical protein